MTKSRSVLFLLLVAVLTLTSLWSAGAPLAAEGPAPGTPPGDGPWVVRAYYTDPRLVAEVAAWTEPWEVRPDEGYVVVDVDRAGYARLFDLGFRVEIDEALTKQLTEPRAYLEGQIDGIPGYPCYRTVEETFTTATQIVAEYPDLAAWIDMGDSWEKVTAGGLPGYDMMVLRLTNANVPGPKPKLFVMAAIHAREYTTAELVTRFAEYLVENYDVDPDATWLLDHHEIHLLLQSNPDGRKKAEAGLSWRKNTNGNYCGPTSNYRGADLNRNYPFQWGCCGGSSGDPCDSLYRGPFANSEPETQAVVAYVTSEFPDQRNDDLVSPAPDDAMGIFLDIHSYSELVMWSWGFTASPAPNSTQLQTLGRKFAYSNDYMPQQAMQLYPTDGTTDDWAYGRLGLASYCFELGTTFFQDCGSFESTIYPDNMSALIYAAKAARTPYMTPAGPDALTVTAIPGGVLPGEPVALTAVVDDTRYSANNGTEPSQNVSAAEYYIDVPPWVTTTTPIAYPMTAVDGAFNETIEDVEATLDTSALGMGRHIIYVRGQDAAGNWGAVSAAFLYVLDPVLAPAIQGTVLDVTTGTPLAATVSAGPFQATTDPDTGFYHMAVLSGTYDVTATAVDHASQTVEDIVAQDGEIVVQDFTLMSVCAIWADDVESGTVGWTAQTGSQWATTTTQSHSPTHSWTDSPGGNYGNNWNYWLMAPAVDLSGASGTTLSFWHRYVLESGWDYGYVEYSADGGPWTSVATYNGQQLSWGQSTLSLPALDGVANARFRFRITTDTNTTYDGWYLDDFEVRAASPACATPLAPSAAFTSNSPVVLGEPVSFTNLTTGTLPISFLWDLGDGLGASTEKDPVYTYASPGTFTVSLEATNAVGTDSVTGTVVVLPSTCVTVTNVELSLLTPGELEPGQEVEIGVELEPAFATAPFSYTVDFGDGSAEDDTAAEASFTLGHVYTQPGTYTVSIAAWNCALDPLDAVTASLTVTVVEPCEGLASVTLSPLTPMPAYLANPVEFGVELAPPTATAPYSYSVDSGDGIVEDGAAAQVSFTLQHVYTQPGTYTVSIDAWNCDMDPLGAVTDSVTVSVSDVCVTAVSATLSLITPPPAFAGMPVELSISLAPVNATPPFSYTVDLGDGSILQGLASAAPFTVEHSYAQAGSYTVTIYISNCGATAPISDVLTLDVAVLHRTYLPIVLK
ncbi:MAG TPA: M14 family zinc carboxypeptidase [Anaerolineae bacterium]|nr:M14 family zinc carboxypeptidase [Anaerolineae bacterium]